MNVTVRDHRGMGAPFAAALAAAGHEVGRSGVLLIDHEAPGPVYDRYFAGCDKAFLYPHGANPMVLNLYPRRPQTCGHFVIGSGQADVTGWYDDRPTEVVGWPYGALRPWRPTEGRKVLLAPVHADGFGWLQDDMKALQGRIHDTLVALPVDLTVRTVGTPESCGITPFPGVRYVQGGGLDTADIDDADVVVATSGTFFSLAVSRGCPVVIYGEDVPAVERHPVTGEQVEMPDRADLLPLFRFPVFDGSLAEQIAHACSTDTAAGWRERFVGDAFDPARFAEVFVKAVESW